MEKATGKGRERERRKFKNRRAAKSSSHGRRQPEIYRNACSGAAFLRFGENV